ncbi:diguanylate cyclase (GGDEF) domain-containing protein [Acetitomaculum ruminis DSM 5522]|uniref:Diguanylate cyclase (GGDEF) domain-containing protein n=1 Tax=Acetitomaculum ruminis DSM 5522 TaxID=1120918 RepID=A0A1I0XD38_9FIRM|nr:HD domain-containing phosphohydrolase [Acetitomaculum ruminis]SFA98942.1 diguanylate cyclase (GGDEF) domain-containing protein [Acetitomaculum ruminis DSM 5522]
MQNILILAVYIAVLGFEEKFIRNLMEYNQEGVKPLRRAIIALGSMTLVFALTTLSNSIYLLSFVTYSKLIILDCVAYQMLLFSTSFSGMEEKYKKILVSVFKVLTIWDIALVVFNMVNPYLLDLRMVKGGFLGDYLAYGPNEYLYMHYAYLYILMVVQVGVLVYRFLRVPHCYKKKYVVSIVCLIGSYALGYATAGRVNAVYGLIFVFFIPIMHHLSDCVTSMDRRNIVKMSQKVINNYIDLPIIVFDYYGKVMEYTSVAYCIFGEDIEKYDFDIDEFFLEHFGFDSKNIPKNNRGQEIFEYHYDSEDNFCYEVSTIKLTDEMGNLVGTLLIFRDIKETKEIQKRLEWIASYDSLTNIYNRSTMISKAMIMDSVQNLPLCITYININGLDTINDIFGFEVGNEVVKYVVENLKNGIKEGMVLGRTEGDEFGIIAKNITSLEMSGILENIRKKVLKNNPFDVAVTFEYGIAQKNNIEESFSEIRKSAREAMVKKKLLCNDSARSALVEALKQSLIENNPDTKRHIEKTEVLARKLGEKLELPDVEIASLCLLAILHDIGKIGVPDNVVNKKAKLNEEEWEVMKLHTIKGYQIACSCKYLESIATSILHHHERWDGKGYPAGLKGEEIPLNARIISLVDSFAAMTNDRPYHKALDKETAIEEIRKNIGSQYDPKIAEVFIKLLEEEKT